jgi:hypothetical protein
MVQNNQPFTKYNAYTIYTPQPVIIYLTMESNNNLTPLQQVKEEARLQQQCRTINKLQEHYNKYPVYYNNFQ